MHKMLVDSFLFYFAYKDGGQRSSEKIECGHLSDASRAAQKIIKYCPL